jgi:hypothetical protein
MKEQLTQEFVRDRFILHEETGILVWKKSRFSKLVGKVAGYLDKVHGSGLRASTPSMVRRLMAKQEVLDSVLTGA